ncbi:M56 family metallopeptidase [Aurantiacibacter luteus]|uniref:M56 family metallopeptidase n=1 Tax=Aurantiacibacter luteus TaxID=1581420 RepID=UPI00069C96C8|nr:M56 family metallopeptidase [Aurantiacibacter luteus]
MSAAVGLIGPNWVGLGSVGLTDWLVETFVYTGLLIAAVLLLRRPVARHFGPQVAYALWALPLLRLVMPPLVLPAWMAPAETTSGVAGEALVVILPQAAAAGSQTAAPAAGLGVADVLVPLWLAGALVFVAWRVRDYVRMRRSLLADARPMGEAGKVRLVETPMVAAPVAFGIRDKVVALPVDFMGRIDTRARDMAIAHELAHHRGHDLLANIAAQPLLALHWFNPLAWWGWRAMRRDQEAACDARVVAGRARSDRVAYAEVIAGFAAGRHLALAAPMACPVLGEKSIIHRLRSLTMTEHSLSRRRLGVAAIAATALALPLTASITYAQPDEQSASGEHSRGVTRLADGSRQWRQDTVEEDGSRHTVVIRVSEDGNDVTTHVVSDSHGDSDQAMIAAEHAAAMADHDAEMADLDAELADLDAELVGLDSEIESEVRAAMAEAREASREAAAEGRRAAAEVRRIAVVRDGALADAGCSGDEPVIERQLSDGRRAMIVCRGAVNAQAVAGLREALAEIRAERDMPAAAREQIIRQLERTIEEMERGQRGAFRMEVTLPGTGAPDRIAALRAMPVPPMPPAPPPVPAVWTGASATGVVVPAVTVRFSATAPVPPKQEG